MRVVVTPARRRGGQLCRCRDTMASLGRWYVGSDPISRPLWRMSSQPRLLSEHVQASILQTLLSCLNSCLGRFNSKDEAILIYLATRQGKAEFIKGYNWQKLSLDPGQKQINQRGKLANYFPSYLSPDRLAGGEVPPTCRHSYQRWVGHTYGGHHSITDINVIFDF